MRRVYEHGRTDHDRHAQRQEGRERKRHRRGPGPPRRRQAEAPQGRRHQAGKHGDEPGHHPEGRPDEHAELDVAHAHAIRSHERRHEQHHPHERTGREGLPPRPGPQRPDHHRDDRGGHHHDVRDDAPAQVPRHGGHEGDHEHQPLDGSTL